MKTKPNTLENRMESRPGGYKVFKSTDEARDFVNKMKRKEKERLADRKRDLVIR